MTNTLLIGGPANGRYVYTSGGTVVTVPDAPRSTRLRETSDPPSFTRHEYYIRKLGKQSVGLHGTVMQQIDRGVPTEIAALLVLSSPTAEMILGHLHLQSKDDLLDIITDAYRILDDRESEP